MWDFTLAYMFMSQIILLVHVYPVTWCHIYKFVILFRYLIMPPPPPSLIFCCCLIGKCCKNNIWKNILKLTHIIPPTFFFSLFYYSFFQLGWFSCCLYLWCQFVAMNFCVVFYFLLRIWLVYSFCSYPTKNEFLSIWKKKSLQSVELVAKKVPHIVNYNSFGSLRFVNI
jgi:hypothetical protein